MANLRVPVRVSRRKPNCRFVGDHEGLWGLQVGKGEDVRSSTRTRRDEACWDFTAREASRAFTASVPSALTVHPGFSARFLSPSPDNAEPHVHHCLTSSTAGLCVWDAATRPITVSLRAVRGASWGDTTSPHRRWPGPRGRLSTCGHEALGTWPVWWKAHMFTSGGPRPVGQVQFEAMTCLKRRWKRIGKAFERQCPGGPVTSGCVH